jgi:uncharacterized membrane protein YebE (DUF533 family)
MSAYLAVIRVWAAAAWADGRIVPDEDKALRRLIVAARLEPADQATALGYLDAPVALDTGELAGLGPEQRAGIYRSALRLVGIDRDVSTAEAGFLRRLQVGLGLDDAEVEAMEAESA